MELDHPSGYVGTILHSGQLKRFEIINNIAYVKS